MLAFSINSSPQRDRNTCSAQRLKPGGKLFFYAFLYCSRGCYKLKKNIANESDEAENKMTLSAEEW